MQLTSGGYPHIPFERYADDIICHCESAEEAQALWSTLADRFAVCKLVLHPQKTKIVYCKDANRRDDFPNQSFDFLGFSFRARKTLWQGYIHAHGFLPAARPKALTSISRADPALGASPSQRQVQYNPYIPSETVGNQRPIDRLLFQTRIWQGGRECKGDCSGLAFMPRAVGNRAVTF